MCNWIRIIDMELFVPLIEKYPKQMDYANTQGNTWNDQHGRNRDTPHQRVVLIHHRNIVRQQERTDKSRAMQLPGPKRHTTRSEK